MNPGDPNYPQQAWTGGQPAAGHQEAAPQQGSPYPGAAQHAAPQGYGQPEGYGQQPGMQSGQWGAQQQWGTPVPAPAKKFDVRAQLPRILIGASVVAGLITFFMGFVSWVSINTDVSDRELQRWGEGYESGDSGIPGFASYEIVLNPGKFFILLGVVAVAAALVLLPRYQRALPFLAVVATGSWLALFSSAIVVTSNPVIDLGAGAIIALIFGFLQFALLLGAAVLRGLDTTS